MVITDQVATAPCTDPIQVRFRLLRQSCITSRGWSYLVVRGSETNCLQQRGVNGVRGDSLAFDTSSTFQ